MPILYNFHIFLATFYMIYWTNLLFEKATNGPLYLWVISNMLPKSLKTYSAIRHSRHDLRELLKGLLA